MTDQAIVTTEPSRKLAAAKASIAASALLAGAKLVAGLWSGSLALLSEAGHAAVDTGATVLTFYAVRESEKPADDEHHYGHGKFEALAALIETGLLFGLTLLVIAEAFRRLREPAVEIDTGWPAYAVLFGSIAIDAVRGWQLTKIAREEKSEALAADALHFTSDLISSVLVVLGLFATQFGFTQGDAIASFGVALFIAVAGYRLGRRTIATLLDAAPREIAPQIETAIRNVPGVIDLVDLRLRSAGADIIGETTVAVARTLRVEQAAQIKSAVAAAIAAVAPDARVTISTEARALDDETVIERIMLVAARRRVAVHHIVAQQVGERLSIGLDLELDGAMPMSRAHAIATGLEAAIHDDFGADVEIETHIEPSEPHVLTGRESDASVVTAITEALTRNSADLPLITNIHDVRVRETSAGFIVNYHCNVRASAPVGATHEAVDEVERRVRAEFPGVMRILGHAEPVER